MSTETHSEHAERIRSELAVHFKDVRQLESRPESNGTFRRVFCLSTRTASPYLMATFVGDRAAGKQTVDLTMHGAGPLHSLVNKSGSVASMTVSLRGSIMNTSRPSDALTCLRAALRDDSSLAKLIDERFPSAAPKPANRDDYCLGFVTSDGKIVGKIVGWDPTRAINAAMDAGEVVIAGHDFAQSGHDATVMRLWIESVAKGGQSGELTRQPGLSPGIIPSGAGNPRPMTPGRLLAAAQRCGRARIHTEPAPVEVPPSTMAELRRLGARTRLPFGDEGPRYDFDEVP